MKEYYSPNKRHKVVLSKDKGRAEWYSFKNGGWKLDAVCNYSVFLESVLETGIGPVYVFELVFLAELEPRLTENYMCRC